MLGFLPNNFFFLQRVPDRDQIGCFKNYRILYWIKLAVTKLGETYGTLKLIREIYLSAFYCTFFSYPAGYATMPVEGEEARPQLLVTVTPSTRSSFT